MRVYTVVKVSHINGADNSPVVLCTRKTMAKAEDYAEKRAKYYAFDKTDYEGGKGSMERFIQNTLPMYLVTRRGYGTIKLYIMPNDYEEE